MFRRLLTFIDSLGDRIHPLVVLHLRRRFRATGRGMLFLGWTIFLAVAATTVFLYADIIFADPGLNAYRLGLNDSMLISRVIGAYLGFQIFIGGAAGSIFGAWQQYWLIRRTDPLLLNIPLQEREIYAGYYQLHVLGLVAVLANLLPYLAFAYTLRLVSLDWVFFYPFVFGATCWTLVNTCYPMSLISRTIFQRVVLAILGIIFCVALMGVGFAWFMAMMVLAAPMPPHLTSLPILEIVKDLTRFEFWFPLFLVAVPTYSYAGWRLVDFNLDRNRPFWRKLFGSLGVYAMITVFLAAFGFGLWFFLPGL